MSAIKTFDVGDSVLLAASFKKAGQLIDPTNVFFRYRNPSNVTTTLQYGVDGAVTKTSTGEYRLNVSANAAGVWSYRIYSTGTGEAAREGQFLVRASMF